MIRKLIYLLVLLLLVGPALGYTLPATNMSGDINFRSYNASNMNALTFDAAGPDIDLNGRKFTDMPNGTAYGDAATFGQSWDKMNKTNSTSFATLERSGNDYIVRDRYGRALNITTYANRAINYAITHFYYTRVRNGNYYCNATLTSNGNRFVMEGEHPLYTKFIKGNTFSGTSFISDYQGYPRFRNIYFDGVDKSIDGFRLNGEYGGDVATGCYFRRFNKSVFFSYGVVGTRFQDCDMGYSNYGIILSTHAGSPSDNNANVFDHCRIWHNVIGIALLPTCYKNVFQNNVIEVNSQHDIWIFSNRTGYLMGANAFRDNYIESSGTVQVKINRTSTYTPPQCTQFLYNEHTSFSATQDIYQIYNSTDTFLFGNTLQPYSYGGEIEIGTGATSTVAVYNFATNVAWVIHDSGSSSVTTPNF